MPTIAVVNTPLGIEIHTPDYTKVHWLNDQDMYEHLDFDFRDCFTFRKSFVNWNDSLLDTYWLRKQRHEEFVDHEDSISIRAGRMARELRQLSALP